MAQTDLVSSSSSELGHGLRPITRTHPRTRQAGRRRLIRSLCMLIAIALGGVVVALCTYLETGRALFICPKCGAQKSEFMLAFANRKLLTWSRPEHSDALDFLHREIPPHECEWQPLRLAGFAAKSFTGVGTRIGRAFLDWTPVFGAAFLQGAPLPSQEARVLFPMTGCILMAARPLK